MGKTVAFTLMALPVLFLAACGSGTESGPRAAEAQPVTYVDSIRPIEEEIRRFRETISDVPDSLEAMASSREELIGHFIDALAAQDTLALNRLVLSRAEFAYLYFPSSRYTAKPYELSPAFLWFYMQENSEKGIARALRRYGGRPLGYAGHRCETEPQIEGENRIWTECIILRATTPADTIGERLFGSIVERDGRFKFVSYANSL